MLLPVTVLFHLHCYVTQMKWDPQGKESKGKPHACRASDLFCSLPFHWRGMRKACIAYLHTYRSIWVFFFTLEECVGVHHWHCERGESPQGNKTMPVTNTPSISAGPACLLMEAHTVDVWYSASSINGKLKCYITAIALAWNMTVV